MNGSILLPFINNSEGVPRVPLEGWWAQLNSDGRAFQKLPLGRPL